MTRQKSYQLVLQNPLAGQAAANVLRRQVYSATVDVGGLLVDSAAPATKVLTKPTTVCQTATAKLAISTKEIAN